jgi:hypothetical protein
MVIRSRKKFSERLENKIQVELQRWQSEYLF